MTATSSSTFTAIFTEKPSVAATVAAVVGAASKKPDRGFWEGNAYRVTWAFGHLVTLAQPESMNPAWGNPWSLQQLPMIPDHWRYQVLDSAQQQFNHIKNLFLDPACAAIINAGDAGREGQLIFDLIYNLTGSRKPVQRLWTSSLTDEAIRSALAQLKPASAFANLSAAAALRQQWDWINGLSASRAYTVLNHQNCPAGRVQTPTLALIVERQHAIDTFKPTPFFEILATFQPGFLARYITPGDDPQTRISDKAAAQAILDAIAPLPAAPVRSLTTVEKKTKPPALYDLLTLQKDANKHYGYTAALTLELAQSLYEEYKVLSYPRTECRHISTDMLPELPHIIHAVASPPQQAIALASLANGPLSKTYVDDTKLTDHHAIIPTSKHVPQDLPSEQRHLYDLVVRRFLGIFYPPELCDETTVILSLADHLFRARGVVVREPGWTVLQPATSTPDDDQPKDADSDDSQQLPTLAQDQLVPKLNAELKSGKTTAPKPYNDSSLLTAMKSAGQDLDDQDLAAYMKQSGLGTPATRAAIIEKLFASGYAERKKKIIQPTPKGVAFIQQVHPKLKDVALTASWEKQLKDIEDGSLTPQAADASFLSFVRQLFPEITAAPPAPIPEDAKDSFGPCPKCKDGSVRKTKLGAGCSRYKAGCTFTIWGEQHHKKLSDSHFRDLVSKRRTSLIKGFQNKDKSKTFDAFLVLTDDFKVQLEFQNDQKKGKP